MQKNAIQLQKGFSLPDFFGKYGTEEQCEKALFDWHWPNGFICSECGYRGHCFLSTNKLYQCNYCKHQTSLTSGTIFSDTKLPLTTWFLAMFLLTQTNNSISAQEMKRQLGVSHCTVWSIKHKLMQVMKEQDESLPLVSFFGHLPETDHILLDPTKVIREIQLPDKLPRPVLSRDEVKRLLATPNTALPTGIRDRALIEVLYATGICLGELVKTTIHHVDLTARHLQVRHPKNGHPRVVPLGKSSTKWLQKYLNQARPRLGQSRPAECHLFLVTSGQPLGATQIRNRLRRYARLAGLEKHVSPLVLRRSCATHMLKNGAGIHTIQQLLGHIHLESTEEFLAQNAKNI